VVHRVEVPAEVMIWARERSGKEREDLKRRFPLDEWESGARSPTYRQLEDYADATYTPITYFFFPEPFDEPLPIPDFRTIGDDPIEEPSRDLLDTVSECQQRQEWYREYALANELDPVPFVDSRTLEDPSRRVAHEMRGMLKFEPETRGPSWSEAFRSLCERAEGLGVLVMVNGVVGANTHRRLDPDEFRGFALVDDLAPTVFVNGADTKAAQVFTLAHELAHLWLGETGLDDIDLGRRADNATERWCNAVAAELLVPAEHLRGRYRETESPQSQLGTLARAYKVSTLVVLRRLCEIDILDWQEFRDAYNAEVAKVRELSADNPGGGGGDFYRTHALRVGKTFAAALISETLAGRTLYTTAFHLLSLRKTSTLYKLGKHVGVRELGNYSGVF